MEGYASYNFDIFCARMWMAAEKTIELVNIMRRGGKVDKLFVNLLGDMISGVIHAEIERTSSLPFPLAVVQIGFILGQVLTILSANFDEIDVKAVSGNHGRLDIKPSFKQKGVRNWDRAVYEIARLFTKDNPKLRWEIADGFALCYQVEGARVLKIGRASCRERV